MDRNVAEALEFWADLYSLCKPTDGSIEIRAFDAADGRPAFRTFVRSNAQMIKALNDSLPENQRLNVFYGVGLRKLGATTGTKDDISAVPALWADIDVLKMGWDMDRTLGAIKQHPLRPSAIVNSGRGLHLYWALAEPPLLHHQYQRQVIEAANLSLTEIFGGDEHAVDVGRILRVPGSYNFKTKTPTPTRVEDANWKEYRLDFLANLRAEDDIPHLSSVGLVSKEDALKEAREAKNGRAAADVVHKTLGGRKFSWSTLWSHTQYGAVGRGMIGLDEAILRGTAMAYVMQCATDEGPDDEKIVETVLHKVQHIKQRDAPKEVWDWRAERAEIMDKLQRFKRKHNAAAR